MTGSIEMGSRQSRHRSIRPRVQQVFLDWLRANRKRFAVAPRIDARTDRWIRITFDGITPMIAAYVGRDGIGDGIGVDVERGGEWFDRLIDLDVAPMRGRDGYFCAMCETAEREYFPTREALWIDHLFEPFLGWVNDELAPARWVRLVIFGGGSRAASLLRCKEELGEPDRAMRLFAGLRDLSGERVYEPGRDEAEVVVIPLRRDGAPAAACPS